MAGKKGVSGAKLKLESDPKAIEDLFECLRMGMSVKSSCDHAMIDPSVFYDYMNKAHEDETKGLSSVFTKFSNNVKKAQSDFKSKHISRITQAADDGSWQASAWLLERRAPDEFALKQQIDLGDSKITVVSDVPADEEDEDQR